MKILDFFLLQAQIRGFFSQSDGLDLNCHVFEYLMMYLFDFTVVITQTLPNISAFWLAAKAASHILGPFSDTESYF